MKYSLRIFAIFGAFWCAFGLVAIPLLAHHGTVGYETRLITLRGTVANFEFSNPHILIYIDAPDEKGNLDHWTIEYSPPSMATHVGWSKNMMKPGDQVIYEIHPAKNGAFIGRGVGKIIINGKSLGN